MSPCPGSWSPVWAPARLTPAWWYQRHRHHPYHSWNWARPIGRHVSEIRATTGLCCTVLCWVVLWYVRLCFAVLFCAALRCVLLENKKLILAMCFFDILERFRRFRSLNLLYLCQRIVISFTDGNHYFQYCRWEMRTVWVLVRSEKYFWNVRLSGTSSISCRDNYCMFKTDFSESDFYPDMELFPWHVPDGRWNRALWGLFELISAGSVNDSDILWFFIFSKHDFEVLSFHCLATAPNLDNYWPW